MKCLHIIALAVVVIELFALGVSQSFTGDSIWLALADPGQASILLDGLSGLLAGNVATHLGGRCVGWLWNLNQSLT